MWDEDEVVFEDECGSFFDWVNECLGCNEYPHGQERMFLNVYSLCTNLKIRSCSFMLFLTFSEDNLVSLSPAPDETYALCTG